MLKIHSCSRSGPSSTPTPGHRWHSKTTPTLYKNSEGSEGAASSNQRNFGDCYVSGVGHNDPQKSPSRSRAWRVAQEDDPSCLKQIVPCLVLGKPLPHSNSEAADFLSH